jgi:hypothetical protein
MTAAALLLFVPLPAWIVEALYSRGAYPWLQNGVTFVSNLVPLAVLDVLLGLVVLLVLVRVVLLVRLARSKGVFAALWEGVRRLLRGAGIVTVLFVLLWGGNYRRVPLAESLAPPPKPETTVLIGVMQDANALAASIRPTLGEDADISYAEIASQLQEPMAAALRELDRPNVFRPGRPKFSLLLTPLFTWAGVNGMVNPLALESIVHPGLLPAERGFVLAHEWAHLAGQADEAEASALGWLACMKGGPALAYSASLYLIQEAAGSLTGDTRAKALAALDPGVREDLTQIAERMRAQQKPQVQRAAFRVYDEYLRANQVQDGTASYGRALTLILSPKMRAALDGYGQ